MTTSAQMASVVPRPKGSGRRGCVCRLEDSWYQLLGCIVSRVDENLTATKMRERTHFSRSLSAHVGVSGSS